MWLSALAWLTGTRAGHVCGAVALAMVAIGLVVLRAYGAGRKSEQLKATQATVDALRTKLAIDRDLHSMAPADRRKELAKWAR